MAASTGTEESPLNREPKPKDLVEHFLTPATGDNLFDRNHGAIPQLPSNAPEKHCVTIDGELVSSPLKLTPQDLSTLFPQHKVICALQCAGNRRHAMRARLKEVQGIDWFDGAILNAEWEGPLLRDILIKAGVKREEKPKGAEASHVAFACYQVKTQEDDWYGGSIPLERVMNPEAEVVLALKMNGEQLTPKHGFPVRAVVPGVIGARSVKWLDRVTVSRRESPNFYQQYDYKILPPEATDGRSAEKYWDKVPPMMDNSVNSVVGDPEDNETVQRSSNGTIRVRGYAIPQGDEGPVVQVDVSTEAGMTWHAARLGPATKYSWVLWEAEVPIAIGKDLRIFSKATDAHGNTQTEERSQWNLRGVGYNGYESTVGLTVQ